MCKKQRRCYFLFVDFTKAFDSIPNDILWYNLLKNGIYHLKSSVRIGNTVTEYFECQVCVRQGCMLSPLLFSIYLNELIVMLKNSGCSGIYVNEIVPHISTLMYADDLVLCSDSVGRLHDNCFRKLL